MRLLAWLLRTFFTLLYQPFAWSYDLVAWLVSLGRWRSWVRAALPELHGPRVLELGHGPGHLQVDMAARQLQPFGLDRSPQMGRLALRNSRKSGLAARLVRGDAARLPYAAASFENVVATFPTEYAFAAQTLAEVRRVLRPGGAFVMLPLAWITGRAPFDRLAAWLFRVTGQAGPWPRQFGQAMAAAGFTVDEQRRSLGDSEILLIVARKT